MNQALPIRLIAADVDGTLLNDQEIMTDRSLRAIRAAQGKGIVFAIASGRYPENVYVLLRDYGLSCPIIGSNGARVIDENRRKIADHPMDRSAALAVFSILRVCGADFFLFGEDALCTSRPGLIHHSEREYGGRIPALGFSYLRGEAQVLRMIQEETVYKFYVCGNVPLPPVREALRAVPRVELTRSSPFNLEAMPQGVDKARGVADLAAALGIPLAQVMTLGDEDNDLSMIRAAGYGVAMGNADERIRRAAAYVTDTNQNDGLARAIERLAL